jgi:hypothetical protein
MISHQEKNAEPVADKAPRRILPSGILRPVVLSCSGLVGLVLIYHSWR